MATTKDADTTSSNGNGTAPKRKVLLVDLGKEKKKHVKRLRKGYGKLMDNVHQTLDQLEEDGEIGGSSDVVIVVVREKKKSKGIWF